MATWVRVPLDPPFAVGIKSVKDAGPKICLPRIGTQRIWIGDPSGDEEFIDSDDWEDHIKNEIA